MCNRTPCRMCCLVRLLFRCGNNYGWVRFEGSRCTEFSQDRFGSCDGADRSFYTPPIFEYCHFDYSYDDSEAVFTGGNNPCGDRFVVGNAVIGEQATNTNGARHELKKAISHKIEAQIFRHARNCTEFTPS